MKKLALALATVAPLALAGTASAKDMTGRFGVGGQIDTGLNSGLSLKYWISDFGLQGLVGFKMQSEFPDGAKNGANEFDLTLRFLYNIARANDTNLYAGAGVSLGIFGGDANTGKDTAVAIDLVLGAEHFFTDFFSVSGQVGLHFYTNDPFRISLGDVASWGTAFHFYF